MDIDWNREVLDQIETYWHHQFRPRLDGLTDDEYFWQPVPDCWTIGRRGTSSAPSSYGSGDFTWDYDTTPGNPEPFTTIAWRLGHLIEGLAQMNAIYFNGPSTSVETFDYAGSAQIALCQLDREHDAWVAGVEGLGAAGLAEPQGTKSPPAFAEAPVARVVMYTSVEVFHHGAEICLLRDLYLRSA